MTTIQNIIDTHDARKAQTILRGAIYSVASKRDIDLNKIAVAAEGSPLVNSLHPASKKMRSVSVSQILDRMSATALGFLLEHMICMTAHPLEVILKAFEEPNPAEETYAMWP